MVVCGDVIRLAFELMVELAVEVDMEHCALVGVEIDCDAGENAAGLDGEVGDGCAHGLVSSSGDEGQVW
jgi:hypothetical protein